MSLADVGGRVLWTEGGASVLGVFTEQQKGLVGAKEKNPIDCGWGREASPPYISLRELMLRRNTGRPEL